MFVSREGGEEEKEGQRRPKAEEKEKEFTVLRCQMCAPQLKADR